MGVACFHIKLVLSKLTRSYNFNLFMKCTFDYYYYHFYSQKIPLLMRQLDILIKILGSREHLTVESQNMTMK
jgi:hypothetical protein